MSNESTNPLVRIFGSSKAIIVMAICAAAFGALFVGKASWEQIESLVKWIVGALIVGQSAEDAAKHIAARGIVAPSIVTKPASEPKPEN